MRRGVGGPGGGGWGGPGVGGGVGRGWGVGGLRRSKAPNVRGPIASAGPFAPFATCLALGGVCDIKFVRQENQIVKARGP